MPAHLHTYGIRTFARYYVNSPKVNLLQHGRFFLEGNAGIEGTNVSDETAIKTIPMA